MTPKSVTMQFTADRHKILGKQDSGIRLKYIHWKTKSFQNMSCRRWALFMKHNLRFGLALVV